jgi:hypothetical protein
MRFHVILIFIHLKKMCIYEKFQSWTSKRQEEFEDTKGVIRIHISKNRQHNGQKCKQRSTKHAHKIKD